MAYLAYVLEKASRDIILETFIPKFPDVIAHHATERHPISFPEMVYYFFSLRFRKSEPIRILSYVCDDSLETLVVSIGGAHFREDWKKYHITLSLDKSKDREAVEANDLIAKGTTIPIGIPISVFAKLRVCF